MSDQPAEQSVTADQPQPSRQAILPLFPPEGWVTVCNWCECVIVEATAHARVCPNNPGTTR